MINARDTFLMFLANNLPGVVIHPLRRNPDEPDSERIVSPAINVRFVDDAFGQNVCDLTVQLDVVHDDEASAIGIAQKLREVLTATYMIPKFDYTDPDNPVPLNSNLMWKSDVRFSAIWDASFHRINCVLRITHVFQ